MAPLSHAVLQEDGGQWVVGKILEGTTFDKRVYQQMVSILRSTAMDQGVIHQLEEVRHYNSFLFVTDNAVSVV